MYVGDNLRGVVAQSIEHLHEVLQNKLRFMIPPLKSSVLSQKMIMRSSQSLPSQGFVQPTFTSHE